MEEDGEEAECGEGPSAPALLQGDDFADAEGYDVTEAPATNGENHISYILNRLDAWGPFTGSLTLKQGRGP